MSRKQNKKKKLAGETPSKKLAEKPTDPKALLKLKTTLGIIVAAFAFILYAQSIFHNYTLDDHPVIDKNKVTKQGIAGIQLY
ncbi:MAG: hypothetical protein ACR2KX_00935 [Chitinophagaceae bacterium]